ncbi:beta-1,4-galactosyltransferase galt-1-like isoform X2 [Rhinatrema bivittatum]|uniref:beta-1,4-galactosyltransferase galt-1-like isoform X2 n=1 Tax=Rhinatrema bivittatum TaxID=194408 RepID=UPI00112B0876|nr:beta-1,4-galactosyltransferase galt-1-like isoform X2 [Rhinatrema bivittatum]XP_029468495.1 beta-1,4-galactosyltransferase galt-1-like isoform X2 [Rhinatrema bivittatum]
MFYHSKRFISLLLVTITMISIFYHLPSNTWTPPKCKIQKIIHKHIHNHTITPLNDNRTFIISPYYDNRDNSFIRVIAIIHHKEVKELYCWFHCYANGTICISKAKILIHSDRWGFPYGTTDLLCLEPQNCEPKYVSIHWSAEGDVNQLPTFEIRNRGPIRFIAEFTICISTMFGNFSNALQFIQTIEMYKLLGAQKVMIYKNSCSQLMEEILQYYITEGTIEVISWPINEYLNVSHRWHYSMDPKDIGYYGQVTSLNDCVYRNMYTSKYVVLNDIDEIILPLKHHDWKAMMKSLQKQNPNVPAFLFEDHVFPHTVFNSRFNMSSWNAIPGFNILQHIYREPMKPYHAKMIVNPRKVFQTSVHTVLEAYGKKHIVPCDTAILFHCREAQHFQLDRASLIRDTTIWKYNLSLIEKVDKVLQKILYVSD